MITEDKSTENKSTENKSTENKSTGNKKTVNIMDNSMSSTPNSNRLHVGIFGETNAGKSSLFNALTETDISIISEISGTTTDSVQKAMELIPFGPIVLIDTAGLGDESPLGQKRMDKTQKILDRVDLALFLIDRGNINNKTQKPQIKQPQSRSHGAFFSAFSACSAYNDFKARCAKRKIPHILVVTKSDVGPSDVGTFDVGTSDVGPSDVGTSDIKTSDIGPVNGNAGPVAVPNITYENPGPILVSVHQQETITALKEAMVRELSAIKEESETLLGGLLKPLSTVLMVMAIDSEAPKGRLILPQNQLVRDCLDNGFISIVVTEKEVGAVLKKFGKVNQEEDRKDGLKIDHKEDTKEYTREDHKKDPNIDLVVTDSQVFNLVADLVPPEIKLTSFSILFIRQKSKDLFNVLIDGARSVKNLKDNDRILVSEVCTHNRSHEDIARVKIPAAAKKVTGCDLKFDFTVGRDYVADPSKYALIIHCGACMITPREMQNRIMAAKERKVPITNYGLFLAYANGVLDRSVEVFM